MSATMTQIQRVTCAVGFITNQARLACGRPLMRRRCCGLMRHLMAVRKLGGSWVVVFAI